MILIKKRVPPPRFHANHFRSDFFKRNMQVPGWGLPYDEKMSSGFGVLLLSCFCVVDFFVYVCVVQLIMNTLSLLSA